jgi:LPS export ABC transporter permease LptG
MLIDRYVFREIAWPSLLGLLAWTSILLANQFFRFADQWVNGVLTLPDVGHALVYFIPNTLVLTIPMSVLLGILVGFSRLSADSEITAMRTTGISYYRLMLPTAVLAILGWGATAWVYVTAVPSANTKFVELLRRGAHRTDFNREVRPGTWVSTDQGAMNTVEAIFARGSEVVDGETWLTEVDRLSIDRHLHAAEHDAAKSARMVHVMTSETTVRTKFDYKDLRVLRWNPDDPSELPTVIEAATGERLGPEAQLPSAADLTQQKGPEKSARLQTLDELHDTLRELDQMDRADAIQAKDPKGADLLRAGLHVPTIKVARDRIKILAVMEIHKKYAIPFACIVLAMAALPLGIATRRGGRPASFIISIGVLTLWWSCYSLGEAWAIGERASPQLAAWLPNIVLGIVGLNLLVSQRRQQTIGLYRGLRDGLLLAATTLFATSALLLFERFHARAADGPRPTYPYWVPIAGAAFLGAHVAFSIWRDTIAARLATVTEAFRRPRKPMGSDVTSQAMSSEEFVGADAMGEQPRPTTRRLALQRIRAVLIFVQLSLMALMFAQAWMHDGGLSAGLATSPLGWEGIALGLMLVIGIALQHAGAGLFSTLDWWVLTRYARMLALMTLSLVFIMITITYLELARSIVQNHIPTSVVLSFFVQVLPQKLSDTMPVAAMIAAVVTFGIMTRFNEMTSLRCGGVSAYRVVAPIMAAGLLVSGCAFVACDYVLPRTNERAEDLRRVIMGYGGPVRRQATRGFLMAEDGKAIYQFLNVLVRDDPSKDDSAQISGLTVLREDANHRVHDLFTSKDAIWHGGQWVLRNGWHAAISGENQVVVTKFDSAPLTGMERPEYFATTPKSPEQMTLGDYSQYIDEQAAAGYPTTALRVTLQKKLAGPIATFVLVLVGIPFGFTTGRRGSLYGLGVSVILAVCYLAGVALFTALGSAGYLPPMAAAWAPNGLFALLGLYLLLHVRT